MGRHAATTTDEDNKMNLAVRICKHQLELAHLVLSSPLEKQQQANDSPETTGGYEKTLTLTFLRALDFPDQLLKASRNGSINSFLGRGRQKIRTSVL